ncbi:hypothetical protein FJY63_09660 [Candidatus Sumerlaeota bacterium]|nr:hypothetical protein [Candidatus Sumerlaeota bacterium]
MTAVLKSEGYPRPPNVPAIRFDAAMPLDFEALRAAGQPGPTTGTLGLGPR